MYSSVAFHRIKCEQQELEIYYEQSCETQNTIPITRNILVSNVFHIEKKVLAVVLLIWQNAEQNVPIKSTEKKRYFEI